VQEAKEASVIGVVVATLGVKAFRDVIDHVCRVIDESGRKRYVFAVGAGSGGHTQDLYSTPNPTFCRNFTRQL